MENTAKNFALQLGALIALYVALTSLLILLFGIINIKFPDELSSYWQYNNAQSQMRFSIAILIIVFPTYLWLTRLVNNIRRKEQGAYLTLTKWLIYLSLLVGGAVLLGDLIAVINAFLNGEITQRFVLKVLAVILVIGAAFYYYLQDAKQHWVTNEKASKLYALAVSAVVLGSRVLALQVIDSPSKVREISLDQQQISDLQDMQWRVEDFYRSNKKLPKSIDMIYLEQSKPNAPSGRDAYQLNVTGETTYELCAQFAESSKTNMNERFEPTMVKNPLNYNWDYQAGTTCFERVISDTPTN